MLSGTKLHKVTVLGNYGTSFCDFFSHNFGCYPFFIKIWQTVTESAQHYVIINQLKIKNFQNLCTVHGKWLSVLLKYQFWSLKVYVCLNPWKTIWFCYNMFPIDPSPSILGTSLQQVKYNYVLFVFVFRKSECEVQIRHLLHDFPSENISDKLSAFSQ